jgi:phytoene synthase
VIRIGVASGPPIEVGTSAVSIETSQAIGSRPDRALLRRCRHTIRHHSKSFYFASMLLPPAKRTDVWAIYAFCRHVDNVVDEAADPEGARSDLAEWRRWLHGEAAESPDPQWIAELLQDVLARHAASREPYLELIDGVELDLDKARYETWDELSEYCYGVASTVGLMLLPVFGQTGSGAEDGAIALGRAMQLTNILRDVGEDLRVRDRIYLPAEEMRAHGVTEEALRSLRIDEPFVRLMQAQIARAQELYERGRAIVARTSPDCRMAVATAARVYGSILDAIERRGYDVLSARAYVPRWRKLLLLWPAWRDTREGT